MGPVPHPQTLTPPPPQKQQKQQQQSRRWRHAHERIASFPAPSEVIRVPARKSAADSSSSPPSPFRKLLILPGNPGCAAFYAPLAEALSEELGGGTEVVALSFHGHGTLPERRRGAEEEEKEKGKKRKDAAARPRLLDLDGQVEHAAAFLEKLLSEVDDEEQEEEKQKQKQKKKEGKHGGGRKRSDGGDEEKGPSVAVVGHSIGGTVAALAVREVEERRRRRTRRPGSGISSRGQKSEEEGAGSRVTAVCAMMPYVAFDEASGQQRALRALASTPLARAPACWGARALGLLLPRAALAALVGFVTSGSAPLTRHARETVADFARAGGLDHALHLADSEFRALSVAGGGGGGGGAAAAAAAGRGEATATATASREEEDEDVRRRKSRKGSPYKFSVSSHSEIWEPLASLGRRASVFAVGRSGGSGGSDGGSGKGGEKDQNGDGDGEDDHWCPSHHLDLLRARAPWMRLELDPAQRHDFVVCDERTARAARAVAGLLRETAAAAAAAAAGALNADDDAGDEEELS